MSVIHNDSLRPLVRETYARDDLARVRAFLDARGTLRLTPKPNGLYAAVVPGAPSASRYAYVWLRDTIMIVNHLREAGRHAEAATTIRTLRAYFERHIARFDRIIDGSADPADPMQRPHIRFDGDTLDELPETWSHAQNDALGYTLWMTCRLAREGAYVPAAADLAVWCRFPAYFAAIEYWRDADSGHWEETPKVESSSIGVVVAALTEMAALLREDAALREAFARAPHPITTEPLDALVAQGRAVLDAFLPHESPPIRSADAALLFLIYPLDIVTRPQADAILANVLDALEGEHGIKRYLGDSYWCAGYKKLLGVEQRTSDFSGGIAERDRLLVPGTEAEWCIFDPVVSVIHGRRYRDSRSPQDLAAQIRHFNRALGQVTPDGFTVDGVPRGGLCPEAYFVEDAATGARVPSDHVPLAWTQANLAIALAWMERSVNG